MHPCVSQVGSNEACAMMTTLKSLMRWRRGTTYQGMDKTFMPHGKSINSVFYQQESLCHSLKQESTNCMVGTAVMSQAKTC